MRVMTWRFGQQTGRHLLLRPPNTEVLAAAPVPPKLETVLEGPKGIHDEQTAAHTFGLIPMFFAHALFGVYSASTGG